MAERAEAACEPRHRPAAGRQVEKIIDGEDRDVEQVAAEQVADGQIDRANAQRRNRHHDFGAEVIAATNSVPTKVCSQAITAARSLAIKGSQMPAATTATAAMT